MINRVDSFILGILPSFAAQALPLDFHPWCVEAQNVDVKLRFDASVMQEYVKTCSCDALLPRVQGIEHYINFNTFLSCLILDFV